MANSFSIGVGSGAAQFCMAGNGCKPDPADDNSESLPRLFVPEADPSELVVYNEAKQLSQLKYRAGEPEINKSSMVVHIDGACRGNGSPTARASYGVYFGPDSCYNLHGELFVHRLLTSTLAEIMALVDAIAAIDKICAKDTRLNDVKIVTDSAFLVDSMSKWIYRWLESGGIGSTGRQVTYWEDFDIIHEKLDEMEHRDSGGIKVQFWHVPREKNREADALANAALDAY